jgi:hypothetical protein
MIGRLGLLRAGLLVLSLALGAGGTLLVLSSQTSAVEVTFAVDDPDDAVDADPSDGLCRTAAGTCTLRAAIQQANTLPDNVVVQLPPGTYELTLPGDGEDAGAQGDLDVTKTEGTLTIASLSAADTLVTWQGVPGGDRLIDVHARAQVEIVKVTLRGGAVPNGDGGAIRNAGTLALTDVVVERSQAAGRGGGIANSGTLRVLTDRTGTTVRRNQAETDGGGIANAAGAVAELRRATVRDNTAGRDGGGVFNEGTLTILEVSLIGGVGGNGGNSAGRNGGGIAHAGGSLTVIGAIVQGNVAGTGDDGGAGGGVWADPQRHLDLRSLTVEGNRATAGGGIAAGMFVLTDSTLEVNRAETDGGGLLVLAGGDARVIGGVIAGNVAESGRGGGIANQATLALSRVSIADNSAPEGVGGGIFNGSSAALSLDNETVVRGNRAASGGGLANPGSGTLANVRVEENTATGNGGGIENSGRLSLRGAVVSGNSAGQHGGGVYHAGSQQLEIVQGARLSGNRAQLDGGGLYASGPVTLAGSELQDNSAGQRGGGILAEGQLIVKQVKLLENAAGIDGGGIYLASGARAVVEDTAVRQNQAGTGVGGGVAVAAGASLALKYASVTENEATLYGGGLGTLGAVEVTNSTLSFNAARQRGGGLWAGPSSSAELQFVTLASNGASAGGALYNDSGAVSLRGVLIAGSPGGGNCGGLAPVSEGGNLEDRNSCLLDGDGDLVNADPDLRPPEPDPSGLTFAHPLGTRSQAIDRIAGTDCPDDDQWHQERPQGAGCDIGAYEVASAPVTPTPSLTPTTTPSPPASTVTPTAQAASTATPWPPASGGSRTPSPVPTVAPWSTPTPVITLPNTGSRVTSSDHRQILGFGMIVVGGFGVILTVLMLALPASRRRPHG